MVLHILDFSKAALLERLPDSSRNFTAASLLFNSMFSALFSQGSKHWFYSIILDPLYENKK